MDIYRVFRLCVLVLLTKEGFCRKSKDKGKNKSDRNDDVTQASIETLRKAKFRDQRRLYVSDVTDFACLHKNVDRLVYRYENKTHIYVGFDSLPDHTLTEMTWRKKNPKSEILDRRAIHVLDPSQSHHRRKQMKTNVILASTNGRQEHLFKENMDSCETSVTQRFCLIQVFADMANKLKTVKFHENCLKFNKS